MDEPRDGISIGDVSRRSGTPASTLRYYEERGLIASIGRRGAARVFHASVLEQLALIAVCRNTGFSLDEIGRLLTADVHDVDRAVLADRADELDAMIRRLTFLRDRLRAAGSAG